MVDKKTIEKSINGRKIRANSEDQKVIEFVMDYRGSEVFSKMALQLFYEEKERIQARQQINS